MEKDSTVANFATVQNESGRTVTRNIDYYNLDVIIDLVMNFLNNDWDLTSAINYNLEGERWVENITSKCRIW